jgi:hypothetical protein
MWIKAGSNRSIDDFIRVVDEAGRKALDFLGRLRLQVSG